MTKFKSLKDEMKRRNSSEQFNAKSPLLFKTPKTSSSKKLNSKDESIQVTNIKKPSFDGQNENMENGDEALRSGKKAKKSPKNAKYKPILVNSKQIEHQNAEAQSQNRKPMQHNKRSNGFKAKNRSFSSSFDSVSASSQSSSESNYLSDSNLITCSNERSSSRNQRKRSLKRSPVTNSKNLMFSTESNNAVLYSQYEIARTRDQASHRTNSKEPGASRHRAPSEQNRSNFESKDLNGKAGQSRHSSQSEAQPSMKLKFSHLLEKFNSNSREDSTPTSSNPSRLANREREREVRDNRESKVRSSTPKMYNDDGVSSSIVNKSSNSFSQNPSSTSYATTLGQCSNPLTPNVDHLSNHSSFLNAAAASNFNNQAVRVNNVPLRMRNNGEFMRGRFEVEERETRSERYARRNYTFNTDLMSQAKEQS